MTSTAINSITNREAKANSKVVAIIGATGTGKSQLAVDLALRHNGEIINCDAVQMYRGLPIITNKISEGEQRGIKHHLLDTIGLHEPTWTVSRFVPEALRIIQDIVSRDRLPILVGGTHYYIQSLLIRDSTVQAEGTTGDNAKLEEELQQPTELLLERLRQVDPVMAERWHPNERRKIQRSLQIWMQTGKRASDIYSKQKQQAAGLAPMSEDEQTDRLRFDPVVFWLHAAPEILKARLDQRVLRMLDAGLLDEIQAMDNFKSDREAHGEAVDLMKGIWASIGYKEFASFLEAVKDDRNNRREDIIAEGIERAQIATRQYAKRQLRWIQYKFLNAMRRNGISEHMFVLDGTDTKQWDRLVKQPAVDIVASHLAGFALPEPELLTVVAKHMLEPKGQDVSHDREEWMKRTCETCQVTTVTRKEWDKHVESKRHQRATAAAAKRRQRKSPGSQNFAGS